MDLGLAGARAVVTGGSKGMGLAIADCLAGEGASVATAARGEDALASAAARLSASGAPEVITLSVDMADADSIRGGFEGLAQRWDSLNVLVHTVGPAQGSFEELDDAGWQRTFDLGTMSAVLSVREALPLLRSADWARIVTLAAHSIQRQSPRLVGYTASEAALASVTKNLSKSLGPEGILVNCVCPGTIVSAGEQLRSPLRSGPGGTSRGDRLGYRVSGVATQRLCDRRDGQRRRRFGISVMRARENTWG